MTQPYAARSLACLLLAGVLATAGRAQAATLTGAELEQIKSEVAAAGPYSSTVVVEDFSGTINEVQNFLTKFMSDFTAQHLDATFGTFKTTAVVILPQDPGTGTTAVKVKMSIGLTVPGAMTARTPLRYQVIRYPKAVLHTHQGAYSDLAAVHGAIAQYAPTGSLQWPIVLQPLNDPRMVDPSAIQTAMITPLQAQ